MDIYLSGRTIAMRASGRPPQLVDIHGRDWKAPLRAWLVDAPRRRWRVWLGGSQCRIELAEPVPGVRSIEEAEAVLSASLGTDTAPIQARLATWSPSNHAPWVAACLPADLPDELTEAIEGQGGRLSCLRPWWAGVTGRGFGDTAWCDDETISYWRTDGDGRVHSAASLPASPSSRLATLQRLGIGGPLNVWELDLRNAPPPTRPGFMIVPVQESTDAAASVEV